VRLILTYALFNRISFESLDEVFSKARNGLLASFSIRKIAPQEISPKAVKRAAPTQLQEHLLP
jgi:hypothetical protein